MSMSMLTASGEPRTRLLANDWEILGEPSDVEIPPNGTFLRVTYANGDDVQVQFREWDSAEQLGQVHPAILLLGDSLTFPLVTAEIRMILGGTDFRFDAKTSQIGCVTLTGNVGSRCGAGLVIE